MNHLAAFVLRLAVAAAWQAPGAHHRARNRYAFRCDVARFYTAANDYEDT